MRKVFLYLYPIKEFINMFLFHDDKLYDEWHIDRPLPILNETINRRYREKGYQIIFALYPDRDLYGIEQRNGDKIIYTDIPFSEVSAYDEKGNKKKNFVPKYPNENLLLDQLGDIDELVVGGYHANDCVRRVAEAALQKGISTLVDLDLTELFFYLYKQKNYFDIENYSPERFKINNLIICHGNDYTESDIDWFDKSYSSPVYGFMKQSNKRL